MAKFAEEAAFDRRSASPYRLLPFRFSRLDGTRYVASNFVGEYLVLERSAIEDLVHHRLSPNSEAYRDLASKHFLIDDDSSVGVDLLALKVRTRTERFAEFTGLHLFVVTLRCEHSCPYCQVSRQNIDTDSTFDMSEETANKSIELVFRSPAQNLKIEFQGGEPLLNFPLIRHIVLRAKAINAVMHDRNLQFVIATNLAPLTDEILAFCKEHDIVISTSLDGPEDLHNRNRPRPGRDSYQRTIDGIRRIRSVLGHDRVSALMTTTRDSLVRPKDIVDEYVNQGFTSIFLRPLSPYGFAVKTKSYAAYDVDSWLRFYKEGLSHIIELNRKGILISESYASIVLSKMLTPFNSGYVDLTSPAGIGIGALLYNYDGSVYASDESRMLAEMRDETFRLGSVHDNSYEEIMLSDRLLDPIENSITVSAPMCTTCAFEPYCGADPVFHHATQGDVVGRKPTSSFCRRNMEIFRHLIRLMDDDAEIRHMFRTWAAQG